MKPFDFAVLSLAVYRLSLMITSESGPFWAFKWLRGMVKRKAPKESHMDEGISCLKCISQQVAIVASVAWLFFPGNPVCAVVVYALALSGAAIVVDKTCKQ